MKNFKYVLKEYEKAKNWLLSLIEKKQPKTSLSQKSILEIHKQKFERTKKFLEFLGNPQNSYKSIHIAGTSGKGSTVFFLAHLLKSSRLKVGSFVKPHLQEPIERLSVNLKFIKPSEFATLVHQVRKLYSQHRALKKNLELGYLDLWTALTFFYFKKEKVDFAVTEAILGGKLDRTNVLSPEISIITTVGFDHIELLGPALEDIAWHKAGIIKPNTPVIVGKCPSTALSVIEKEAKEKKAPLYVFGRDFNIRITHSSREGVTFNLSTPFGNFKDIHLPLQGHFQAHNFALAFVAYKLLQQKHRFAPIKDLNEALKDLSFPGRLEVIQENPTVILDGAHNPQKIASLAQTIQENYPDAPGKILVIGLLETKDADSMAKEIAGLFDTIITTAPQVYGKIPLPANKLKRTFKALSPSSKTIALPEPEDAVKKALSLASSSDLIVITGSIYLVGNARELWRPSEEILYQAEYGNTQL